MKNCSNCGNKLEPRDKNCSKCGVDVTGTYSANPQNSDGEFANGAPAEEKVVEHKKGILEDSTSQYKKGKIRSLGSVVGLSIITFGIYIFYWLYINLKEIEESFTFDENETTIKTAKNLFVFFIIFTVLNIIISFSTANPRSSELNPIAILFSLISVGIGLSFFYYFTASVALGQAKARLTNFDISSIYGFYVFGIILTLISGFIAGGNIAIGAILSLIGLILIIVYYYKILKEINKIWLEGNFDSEQQGD